MRNAGKIGDIYSAGEEEVVVGREVIGDIYKQTK